VSAPILDSREIDLAAAKDILARLERYAASVRAAPRDSVSAPATAPPKHPMATTTAPRVDSLPAKVPWKQYGQPTVQPLAFPPADTHIPRRRRTRINPATADLFPYDLAASIVACAATIIAYISFGRPVAVGATIALAVAGEWMRRARWFPSIGGKLLIGTVVGLLLVFTA
jgi:hypothetical protein